MLIFLFNKVKISIESNEFLRENINENLNFIFEYIISKLNPYILYDDITFRCAEVKK